MKQLMQYKLRDDTPVWVEVETDTREENWTKAGLKEIVIENTIKNFMPIANSIIDEIRTLGKPDDEIEVEFGLGFSSKANMFISDVSGNTNLKVKIRLGKKSQK
jgi:hypothetical protein